METSSPAVAERAAAGAPKRHRVAVLNTQPVQYFAPLYAYLSTAEDLDVTVLYATDASLREDRRTGFGHSFRWDIDVLEGYRSVFLGAGSRTRTPGGFLSLLVPEVWTELRSGRYDAVIVHGHQYAVNMLALIAARLAGVKAFLRCDSHHALGGRRIPWWMRRLTVGTLYRLADRALATGSANAAFYRRLGVPDDRIHIAPFAVDNDRFMRESSIEASERRREREALGIDPDRPVLLFASKFQPRKRPDDVIRAAAELERRGAVFTLLMVGDGEMREDLEQLAGTLGLTNVVFTGFVNQSRLPVMYGISDVFVLASEDEPWGLVVNEVMCAGLPIVLADGVGCAPDLLEDGDNGFLFPPRDFRTLADVLYPLLSDADLRRRMGERSRARIQRWSYREYAEGLRKALRTT